MGSLRRLCVAVTSVIAVACSPQMGSGHTTPDPISPSTLLDRSPPATTLTTSGATSETTDEVSNELIAEVYASYAFPPGGPFPVGSIEWIEWLAECENSFGFDFEVVSQPGQDPTLFGQVPPSRDTFHSEVRRACRAFVAEQGDVFELEQTPEFAERVYAGYLKVHECMLANGFPVDEPPSQQTFVSQWVAGGAGSWHPYSATPFGGSLSTSPDAGTGDERVSEQLHIQETCPADWGTVFAAEQ